MHLRHDYAQATSKSLRDENRDLRLSFLPALSKLLYIVNKQLTQAKEAKKHIIAFLDAEKINQCNPILGQR